MVTTEAPMMPVQAPKRVETTTTAMASPPRMGPKTVAHGVEELLGHAGLVQQLGHEDEQRDAHQDVVVHGAPGLVQEHVKGGRAPADIPEDDGQAAQHKGQRVSHEKADQKTDEHADG